MTCCPHCHGTGQIEAPSRSMQANELVSTVAALRAVCVAANMTVTGDNRVDEPTAAMLIGRKAKTLCNWRHTGCPITYHTRRRRIEYRLEDLARWMAENDEQPEF